MFKSVCVRLRLGRVQLAKRLDGRRTISLVLLAASNVFEWEDCAVCRKGAKPVNRWVMMW